MANQPQKGTPPKSQPPQGQQQGGQQDPAAQALLQAGVPQQHIQQAEALGISAGQLAGIFGQLLPVILQIWQSLQQGGGAHPSTAGQAKAKP